jgi:signal transduction histidine kinase
MNIYSIPSLLSAIVLVVLFAMGILKARRSSLNLLFALLCLLGCLLNIDKTILTVINDRSLALRVSRIDHAFLVFVIPLYLHFAVLATGHKGWLPLVKVFYVIAVLLIPLTQQSAYISHIARYSFGYFAISGPLFIIFGVLSALSLGSSLYLLIKNLKEEKVSIKRTRIKYILLSLGLAAFMNHFDIMTMHGYDVYPLGNFVFVPMSILGYAIYKHDVMEWKIFLNKGIVFFSLLFLSAGFFAGLEVLLQNIFHSMVGAGLISVVAMMLTFVLVYLSNTKVQGFLRQFLEQEFIRSRKEIRDLSSEILKVHNIDTIKTKLKKGLSATFSLDACRLQMVARIDEYESPALIREGDPLWGQGYRLSVPIPSQSHPAYLLLGEKGTVSLYTRGEIEILSMLAHNVALAFDNARAYKKIEDFSNSLEKLVDERTRALVQSESLAAVGRLAAGVAHELNNPIAAVMSTLEYSIDHMEQNGDLYDDLVFSLQELRRARDIVKSLLDASRQKDEVKVLVDIHSPIQDALKILYNQYKTKDIIINRVFQAEQSLIKGNSPRLCQVFINLIKNSIDALGERPGTITIETSNKEEPDSKVKPNELRGLNLVCTVTDTGQGIEKKKQKDIFKPFFTTKEQGKGIGLGLFIVFEILKDHEGSIEVKSTESQGTTVTLTFPCHSQ